MTATVMAMLIVRTAFLRGETAALIVTTMETLAANSIGDGARDPEMARKTEPDALVNKTGLST